jgi:hypothetical protein
MNTDANFHIKELKTRGISTTQFESSIERFKKGFPFVKILEAATPKTTEEHPVNGGIKVITEEEKVRALKNAFGLNATVCKFVPASGAASRMFKDVFAAKEEIDRASENGCNKLSVKTLETIDNLKKNWKKFPFELNVKGAATGEKIIHAMIDEDALNLGAYPKGLIPFHKYAKNGTSFVRTPFEEHLVEGALYARDIKGNVRIIFTVSPEHVEKFKELFERVRDSYEKGYSSKYNLMFTLQSAATDIVAVDKDNKPFVKEDGTLLFRPGGHGALLRNLNDVDADYIFVKNIDNVVKETFIKQTEIWKKILLGRAVELHNKCGLVILNLVESLNVFGKYAKLGKEDLKVPQLAKNKEIARQEFEKAIRDARNFLNDEFCVVLPEIEEQSKLVQMLLTKLNRPIRVCGMVKNEGEPGGGPFIVMDADGSTSLQILEGPQIDKSDPKAVAALKHSTHFNPVDIVCSVKNFAGNKFNLMDFTDPNSGLISEKSYKGTVIKAQELPGLWNGSMSNWNTQFIETPLITFNPVKTVFDLLRKEHQ